ncbi:MAG TPA: HAD family hydrolase [Euryarchaeota archaeon]|nr:HAD family hydrolase [Euryarchaeota archaeon]HIQ09921.1 HAD family hydrolase [Euryarchaeota archaeon]
MLGVLFDLDGTLIDSIDLHLYSFLDVLEALGIPKKPGLEEEFRRQVGKRFVDIVRSIYPDMDEATLREVRRLKWEFTPRYAHKIRVLPHVYDTLDALYGKYPLALVTSSSRRFVDLVFQHTRPSLKKYFSAVVTAEDVVRGKPDPEPFLLGAKRIGVDSAVVVGDTDYDRIAAEKAGFRFVHAREMENLPKILESIRQ